MSAVRRAAGSTTCRPNWVLACDRRDRVVAALALAICLLALRSISDRVPVLASKSPSRRADRTPVERAWPRPDRRRSPTAPVTLHTTYLLAEFAAGACESLKFDVIVRYNSPPGGYDFTRTIHVRPPLEDGVRRIFSAIYSHSQGSQILEGTYSLAGLDLPRESAACLSGLYRIKSVSGLPLVLDVNLPSDWEQRAPFHTLDGIESRPAGQLSPDIYTFPPEFPVGRSLVLRPVQALSALDIEQRSPTLETAAERWRINGNGGVGGRGPYLYRAKMKAQPARAGEMRWRAADSKRGDSVSVSSAMASWVAPGCGAHAWRLRCRHQSAADGEYSVVLANEIFAGGRCTTR